jgi:hypothetical protein
MHRRRDPNEMLSILSAMANPAKPELTDDDGGPDTSDTAATETTSTDIAATETAPADLEQDPTTAADEADTASTTDTPTTDTPTTDTAAAAGTRSTAAGSAARSSAATSAPKKVLPPKAKAKAKVAPGNSPITPSRHTPSQPTSGRRAPSPRWVPVLMFALWGLGLLLIVLNYMGVLPGTEDAGNGWYLVAGLVSILGGIMVATQYH